MRCLFVSEGTSDHGIAGHVERLAIEEGLALTMTIPDFSRLHARVGSTVEGKLSAARELAGEFEMVVVHRDADGSGHVARKREIETAVKNALGSAVYVAVVPVRMTEAWLVLDEGAIRQVSGNPNGTAELNLPAPRAVERIADPKALLKHSIAIASEAKGRRLATLNRRFGQNRARLMEQLSWAGPVSNVPSWVRFVDDVRNAVCGL